MESNQGKQVKDKQILHNENRLRKLNDCIRSNNVLIIGFPKEKREMEWQKMYLNNSWKWPEYGEGNRDPDLGGTETPQEIQPKKVHVKTHSKKNGKK